MNGAHKSQWNDDGDGFTEVGCKTCAWYFIAPDAETAADAWGEHQFQVGRIEAGNTP